MSLIFSALAELDQPTTDASTEVPAPTSTEPVRARRWLPLTGLAAAGVLLAGGAWLAWPSRLPAPTVVSPARAAVAAPPQADAATVAIADVSGPTLADERHAANAKPANVRAAAAAMPAAAARSDARGPGTDRPAAAHRPVAAEVASLDHAESVAAVASAPAATRRMVAAAGTPKPVAHVAAANTPEATEPRADTAPTLGQNNSVTLGRQPSAVSDDLVAQRVEAFSAAMRSDQSGDAGEALAALEDVLAPRSLTLIRMQAWFAFSRTRDHEARKLYQNILQRVPDDITAGVNIAVIDWRNQRRRAARSRISELHIRFPDSALVQRYWYAMQRRGG